MIAVLKAILGSTDLKRVHELQVMAIPESWKEAWIFLDHTPCQNVSAVPGFLPFAPKLTFARYQCWIFLHRIKQVTGIGIYVETRPLLAKKNRQDDIGCRKCACARCKRRFGAEQARGTSSKENTTVPGHDLNPKDVAGPTSSRAPRVSLIILLHYSIF